MEKNKIVFFLLLSFSGLAFSYKTQNVLVVIIDGPRYSETFGDTSHQFIPKLWDQLKPLGTLYTRFYNDTVTETVPGHSSIVTGTWQVIANNDEERPHVPTIFEYFRKERGTSAAENYVILGKKHLEILSYSDFEGAGKGYGKDFGASVKKIDGAPFADSIAWNNIREILSTVHPRLAVTNLPQIDGEGHAGDSLGYLKAIKGADSIVNEIWNLLQSEPFYKDKTTLIVTCDHGRHTHDYRDHRWDGCEGCRHCILLVLGPDTKPGVIDSTRYCQIDIAPTVGRLLGFSLPFAAGKIIESACPPLPPSLAFPADSASITPRDLVLAWNPVRDRATYHVQLSANAAFSNCIRDRCCLTDTTQTTGPMAFNTRYYWHVRAINEGGEGDWSATRTFTTIPESLDVPLPFLPVNGSTGQPISTVLRWRPGLATISYGIQVSLSPDFADSVIAEAGIPDTFFTPPGLAGKTTYYWRVNAITRGVTTCWSRGMKFTTIIAAPDIPVPSAPADKTIGQSVSPTLSWRAAERAETYDVQLAGDTSFSNLIAHAMGLTATDFHPTGLDDNSIYQWRVRAKNEGGTSDWSNTWNFITLPGDSAVPQLSAPVNKAEGEPVAVVLSWQRSDVALSYDIQVSKTPDCTTADTNVAGITDTFFALSSLANKTSYYWRVKAIALGGNTEWTNIWEFTTIIAAPDDSPTALLPADNDSTVPIAPLLLWNRIDDASSYWVQVSRDSMFDNILYDRAGLTDTSYTLTGFVKNSLYFWRINASNAGGTGVWSRGMKFITIVDPPDAPRLVSPLNDSAIGTDSLCLVWERAFPNVSRYWIEIASDSAMSDAIVDSTNIDTIKTLCQLKNNSVFWWRVKAYNRAGWGGFCSPQRFSIAKTRIAPTGYGLKKFFFSRSQGFITYELPTSCTVHLRLFDLKGKLVYRSERTHVPPGCYTDRITCRMLPCGNYFLVFRAGPFAKRDKIVIVQR